jgi:hypothetical protein
MPNLKLQLPDPAGVVFVHYLCQEFEEGEQILSLMLARGDDSIVHRWDVTSEESEINALEDYFAYLDKECRNLTTVHWNQGTSFFGLNHLNKRYNKAKIQKKPFNYHNPFNLSDYLINKYGDKYIGHPRLDKLADLNGFTGKRSTDKEKRTFADHRLLLIMKIYFTEFRGELKIQHNPLNTERTLADYILHHKDEIIAYLQIELFQQKGKKVAVVIYALKELSLIDFHERKEFYDVLRKLLGDIGSNESLNKILRYQLTQHDHTTQEGIRTQMLKIKHYLNP